MLHSAPPKYHGFTTEKYIHSTLGKFPQDSPYPSIFKLVGERHYSSLSIAQWRTITNLIIEDDIPNCVKITVKRLEQLVADFKESLQTSTPAFVFLAIDDCDGVGHRQGYFTDAQVECLKHVDSVIAGMIEMIEKLPGENYIMLASDHGGGGVDPHNHGSAHPQDMTAFWSVTGPGIRSMTIPEMEMVDIGRVAAEILKLPIPNEWQGRVPQGFRVP